MFIILNYLGDLLFQRVDVYCTELFRRSTFSES